MVKFARLFLRPAAGKPGLKACLWSYFAAAVLVVPVSWAQTAPSPGETPASSPAAAPVEANQPPSGTRIIVPTSQPSPQEMTALSAAKPAIQAKRWEEARKIIEPLAESPSATFDVLVQMGGVYDRLAMEAAQLPADDPVAKAANKKLYDGYAEKAIEYYLRAGQLGMRSLDPRTETVFEQVRYFDPGRAEALKVLGTLAQAGRAVHRALFYFEEYCKTEQGKSDYDAQVRFGSLLVEMGDWRRAVEVLDRIRELGGNDARHQLARAYMQGKQMDKALGIVTEAIQREPNDPEAYMIRAGLILSMPSLGRPVQAVNDALKSIQLAREAVRSKPEEDAVWAQLSELHSNCETIIKALNAQALADQLDPLAALRLSELIVEDGLAVKMRSEYDAAALLSLVGGSENADLDLLVSLLRRLDALKRPQDARQVADRILKRDPSNPVVREFLSKSETASKPAGG